MARKTKKEEVDYKAEYMRLQQDLIYAERKVGAHALGAFSDSLRDEQNIDVDSSHPDYWMRMFLASASAAGSSAEEYGININQMLGRDIY